MTSKIVTYGVALLIVLCGGMLQWSIRPALADQQTYELDELRASRRALESIAHSLEKCPR